jgi:hypothetical protein
VTGVLLLDDRHITSATISFDTSHLQNGIGKSAMLSASLSGIYSQEVASTY